MLAFAPGRLSTIATPLKRFDEFLHASYLPVEPFDPADLPCPPMSVMEKAWYMPEPWVPYRPIFALPDEIRSLREDLVRCSNIKFAALDPPIPLSPRSALVPGMPVKGSLVKPEASTTRNEVAPTSTSSMSPGIPPIPGATLEQGAVKTGIPEQASTPSNKVPSASYPPNPDNKKDPHDTNTVKGDNVDGSRPLPLPSKMHIAPEGAPRPAKAGSASGATLVNGEVPNVELNQHPSHVHDNSVASRRPDSHNSNAEKDAPNIDNSVSSRKPDPNHSNAEKDAPPNMAAVQHDQHSTPTATSAPASNYHDPPDTIATDTDTDIPSIAHHHTTTIIPNTNLPDIRSALSKYGVTLLRPGGAAATLTPTICAQPPVTLSLDTAGNLHLVSLSHETIQPLTPSISISISIPTNQPPSLIVPPHAHTVSVAGTGTGRQPAGVSRTYNDSNTSNISSNSSDPRSNGGSVAAAVINQPATDAEPEPEPFTSGAAAISLRNAAWWPIIAVILTNLVLRLDVWRTVRNTINLID